MTKKTIFILFCIVVAIASLMFFYYEDTIFSKQFLTLEITGQDLASLGDEVTYTVKYKNNSNFILEDPKIIFELPEHSLTEDGKERLSQSVKNINPGEEDFVKFSARLLGKEGDLKVARAWFSYTPQNLSVRYESDTTFTTKIEKTLIDVNFDLPQKVSQGKELNYAINYLSNVDYPLENLSIKVETAGGFDFISSNPSSLDYSEWKLKTLTKNQGGAIKVKGLVLAEPNEVLRFFAKLGMWKDGTFIVIKEVEQNVEVTEPLLLISQTINNDNEYTASLGEVLNYKILIKNNGENSLSNIVITSRLSGLAFDFSTLISQAGQIKLSDNSITFNAQKTPTLSILNPGQEVVAEFSIKLKDSLASSNNIFIKNKVSALDMVQEFSNQVNVKK